ncbi:MAG: hypothetical protein WC584_02330 [Candidatus Pacearchaeota archaeon]
MKKGIGKRGLSDVVVSLIMILLVLLAIGIVWVVVKGIITNTSEDMDLTGLTIDMKITEVINDRTNPPSLTGVLNIKIKRNPGEGDLNGLIFVFEGNGKSGEFKTTQTINEVEEKQFSIIPTDLTTIGFSEIGKVSVVPIFKLKSGKEKQGNIADEVELNCVDDNPLEASRADLKGTSKTNFGDYTDYCGQAVINEYYCFNTKFIVIKKVVNCPPGDCNDGACISV